MQKYFVILIGCLIHSVAVHAEGEKVGLTWEIAGYTNAYISTTKVAGNSSDNRLEFGARVGHFLTPNWEIGAQTGLSISWPEGIADYNLMVGPTYNFGTDIPNSFYLSASAGMGHDENFFNKAVYSPLLVDLVAGKRFGIVEHISWSPEFAYRYRATATTNSTGVETTLPSYIQWTLALFRIAVLF